MAWVWLLVHQVGITEALEERRHTHTRTVGKTETHTEVFAEC